MIHLDHLPVELLSLIVTNIDHKGLYHCALVNKQLHAATIPVLWRSPKVDDGSSILRITKGLSLARSSLGLYIRKLCFDKELLDSALLLFLDHATLLEELTILHAELISDKSIQQLSRRCPQLKKLRLYNANITHRSVHYLGQRCHHLRELALKGCHRLLPITLLPFADCPLEYLDLSECRWLTVEDTALDLVQFNRLTHLELVCCRTINLKFIQQLLPPPSPPSLDGSIQSSLSSSSTTTTTTTNVNATTISTSTPLPLLTYFAITGTPDINDHVITPFIKSHTALESLHLLKCSITDATLDTISTYLPTTIHALGLFGCENITSHAVRKLIRACPHLLMIGLENCLLPLHAFPEVTGRDGRYVQILGYADIMAIRSNPDTTTTTTTNSTVEEEEGIMHINDGDNDMDMDDDGNNNNNNDDDDDGNDNDNDMNMDAGNDDMNHNLEQTTAVPPQGNEINDGMDEVRALVLSLADNTHYSI
ncbi:hypothetical protein BCR42DRAFT_418478 [Absidia repens]|uniref:F-box domain-containing protein n=1 Tax=Absidia repens TaxID=90262 RepID=A0A1X2IC51_9FUNG|nr:hypothetical protein BCR42DRAFT_418478 [Absidia repens]